MGGIQKWRMLNWSNRGEVRGENGGTGSPKKDLAYERYRYQNTEMHGKSKTRRNKSVKQRVEISKLEEEVWTK